MLKPISESKILKKYSRPLRQLPDESEKQENSTIETFPTSSLDMPIETFEKGIKRRHRNRQVLLEWIKENLIAQIDYGKIHLIENCPYARNGTADLCSDPSHWSKPVLWKSGSEKILGVLGLSVHFPNSKIFELAVSHKQELNQIILKCQLKTQSGTVVSDGIGARSIEQDGFNLNKSLKMTAKAAVIDATIRVAGLSNVFIQSNTQSKSMPRGSACRQNYNQTGTGSFNQHQRCNGTRYITKRQQDYIHKLSGKSGLTIEALEKRCRSSFNSTLKKLQRHHASQLIHQLNEGF